MRLAWVPLLVLQSVWEAAAATEGEGEETKPSVDCSGRGFTAGLLCSACSELSTFGLSDLSDDCLACCTPDHGDQANKVLSLAPFGLLVDALNELLPLQVYPRAILEVCG